MSNWEKEEITPNAITWLNKKYAVRVALYLMNNRDWEVNLGQGSNWGHYNLITNKRFPTKAKAMLMVSKLKNKYNNGWM